ncbi:MAG: peroxiredoxin family protein [Rhizomicrobium sp.]
MRLLKMGILCLIPALAVALHAQADNAIPGALPGLKPGDRIPSISAKDQSGTPETFDTLKGKRGLLLLFSRSADWCPFCKQQLLELQQAKQEFAAKGIHVASITYDSQAILKSFADRKDITYPMLSDPQSKIIRAFGILNPEAKGFAAGVPYPGLYYISADGVIQKRFFEAQYYDRFTPSDAYAEIFGKAPPTEPPFIVRSGRHVTVQLTQSDKVVGPGSRLELLVTVVPAAGVHVYAPGAETYGYKVVKLKLNSNPNFKPLPTAYPGGSIMNFPVLKQSVPVYNKPTVIRQDVIMSATREFVHSVGQGKQIEVTGTLDYQACNDHECFNPVFQPVQWTLRVIPLDFVRAPEAIRHQ